MKKITLLIFISFAVLIGCPPPGTDPTQPGGDNKIAVTSVKITAETNRISRGTSLQLNVEVLPANASDKTVQWKTSDPNTATVNGGLVFTADDAAAGKVTITAVSASNPEVEGTIELEIPEISEVVYRNGKGYRLASLFDFETTGLNEIWTRSSEVLTPKFENGFLIVDKKENQKDTTGISYPLVLDKALYNNAPLPADKPIAYVEISAKLSTDGVGSGIGVGIGINGIDGTNQGRGWGNEFFDDFNGMKTRFNDSARTAITIKENTNHLFGISFTESDHESFMDGNLVSSAKPQNDNFKLAGKDRYYLYFGTEGGDNANEAVTVTVDYVAFYYLDEEIEVIEVKEPTIIPATVEVEGKTLKLTHYDTFDSWDTLEENWDIGNPGIYRPEIGNKGETLSEVMDFGDGIKGYSGDRYKQPYWSPRAVEIKDGELLIKVYFDKTIENKNLNNNGEKGYIPNKTTLDTVGYGVAGAIHSKRQFPSGLFVTKIKHSWGDRAGKTSAHWDAWWAESNNPFSKEYGKKELFSWGTDDSTRRGKVFTDGVPETRYKGVNGEQVYEYDMYEWVYDNNTQYQVLHSWPWYGGYPGWDDIPEEMRNQSRNYWITDDSWRSHDARGAGFRPKGSIEGNGTTEYGDGGQAKRGDWFYLAMLVTPEKVVMWNFSKDWNWDFSAPAVSCSETTNMDRAFGNSAAPVAYRDADGKSPIQVKYSSELGQWNNSHDIIYNNRDKLTPENPDIMHAEFFAFYAWDTESGKYKVYTEDVDG